MLRFQDGTAKIGSSRHPFSRFMSYRIPAGQYVMAMTHIALEVTGTEADVHAFAPLIAPVVAGREWYARHDVLAAWFDTAPRPRCYSCGSKMMAVLRYAGGVNKSPLDPFSPGRCIVCGLRA